MIKNINLLIATFFGIGYIKIAPGTFVMFNPPYGERIGELEDLENLYGMIGDVLKKKCGGSEAHILTANNNLAKCIGLKSESKIVLKNGKIDCRLLHFPIRLGKYAD